MDSLEELVLGSFYALQRLQGFTSLSVGAIELTGPQPLRALKHLNLSADDHAAPARVVQLGYLLGGYSCMQSLDITASKALVQVAATFAFCCTSFAELRSR